MLAGQDPTTSTEGGGQLNGHGEVQRQGSVGRMEAEALRSPPLASRSERGKVERCFSDVYQVATDRQRLFREFVQYIVDSRRLLDEQAARDWIGRELGFPVKRLHNKISFCNARSLTRHQVQNLQGSLTEDNYLSKVEDWLASGDRKDLWTVNWKDLVMWPNTAYVAAEDFTSTELFVHLWYWKFGCEFRAHLRSQGQEALVVMLERRNPFLEQYRWSSDTSTSSGLQLGIDEEEVASGKAPWRRLVLLEEEEEEGEESKEDGEGGGGYQRRRRSSSLGSSEREEAAAPAPTTERFQKPPLKRDLSDTSVLLATRQRLLANNSKPAPILRLGSLPSAIEESVETPEDDDDEEALPDPRLSRTLLAAGVVLCSRSNGGSRYEVVRLAGGTLPVVDAFAERKGSRSSYWNSEQRRRVFIRSLMVLRSDDRKLARAKATLQAFRRLACERFVRVHDNMLIRAKDRGASDAGAYCVVMERLEFNLGHMCHRGVLSLSLADVEALALQSAEALRAWHDTGRAHGDVTPLNMFLEREGGQQQQQGGGWRVKLGCLGLGLAWDGAEEKEEHDRGSDDDRLSPLAAAQAADVRGWAECWLVAICHAVNDNDTTLRPAGSQPSGAGAGGGGHLEEEEALEQQVGQLLDVSARERALQARLGEGRATGLVAALARALAPRPQDRPSVAGLTGILRFLQRWKPDLPEVPPRQTTLQRGALTKLKRALLHEPPREPPATPTGGAAAGGGGAAEVPCCGGGVVVERSGGGQGVVARSPVLQVCGMGGVGKTTIVSRALDDPDVWARYPDGVMWLGMRQEGTDDERLQRKQLRVLRYLLGAHDFNELHLGQGDGPRLLSNPMLWSDFCREKLASKACLVIVDGVWQPEHARAFDFLGPRALLLLTTRRNLVGGESRAKTLRVKALEATGPDASKLLHNYARPSARELAEAAPTAGAVGEQEEEEAAAEEEVQRVCEGVPLSLAIVGSLKRTSRLAWTGVRDALRRSGGLQVLAANGDPSATPHGRYAGLHAALEASVAALGPQELECLHLYAVWRENTWVEERLVARVMALEPHQTLALLHRLANSKLIIFEPNSHRSTVPGLVRGYLKTRVTAEEARAMHLRTLERGVVSSIVCGNDRVFDEGEEEAARFIQQEICYMKDNFWYHLEQVPEAVDEMVELWHRVRGLVLYRYWAQRWGLIKAILSQCKMLRVLKVFKESSAASSTSLWGTDMEECVRGCVALSTVSFPNVRLAGGGNDAFLKGLRHCTTLKTLDLPHLRVGEEGAKALIELLLNCSLLEAVNLRVSNVGGFGLDGQLVAALRHCRSLRSLDLSHCGLETAGLFREVLANCANLLELRLDGNRMGGSRMPVSLRGRPQERKATALRSLSLSCASLDDGGLEAVCQATSECGGLHSLDLSKNRLGPMGAALLAGGLLRRCCRHLRELNLSYTCSLPSEGQALVAELSSVLGEGACPELTLLDLRGVPLDDDGLYALGLGIKPCASLHVLLLTCCDAITMRGAEDLGEALRASEQRQQELHLYLDVSDAASAEANVQRLEKRLADYGVKARRCESDGSYMKPVIACCT